MRTLLWPPSYCGMFCVEEFTSLHARIIGEIHLVTAAICYYNHPVSAVCFYNHPVCICSPSRRCAWPRAAPPPPSPPSPRSPRPPCGSWSYSQSQYQHYSLKESCSSGFPRVLESTSRICTWWRGCTCPRRGRRCLAGPTPRRGSCHRDTSGSWSGACTNIISLVTMNIVDVSTEFRGSFHSIWRRPWRI